MLTAVLLLLAQPGDVVQTHDLGTIPWRRAKALEGRRVRVRFTVGPLGWVAVPSEGPEAVLVEAEGPGAREPHRPAARRRPAGIPARRVAHLIASIHPKANPPDVGFLKAAEFPAIQIRRGQAKQA
jgi:hypothetical protein